MEEVEETNGAAQHTLPHGDKCKAFFAALQYRAANQSARSRDQACCRAQSQRRSPESGRRRRARRMDCTINWMPANGMAFSAETGSGHLLVMDGAADGGGRNLAPRPMETVLAGTGGCTAYDVVLILQRGRFDVRGCQVKVTSERAEVDPKVFTRIHLHFIVSGPGLTDTAVERAVRLSHEKYCSATIMLGKTADITTSFEIKPA
jgi:putative redox protein